MMRLTRLISAVLALTLAGGAQACVVVCGLPAKPTAATAARTTSACRHCGNDNGAPGQQPRSMPSTPCKHCQAALQDRVAAEPDHIVKAPTEYSVPGPAQMALLAFAAPVTRITERAPVHPPAGCILHEFCILLI
jgi:hypothetical protein